MPKISVVIPVYKVEEYLRECLDSVINQTFQDIEIICVDDKTPDNSVQIITEYMKNDRRVKFVCHEKNKGLGEARNTGIDVATGEYIFFLDSDDSIKLDILEKLYNTVLKTKSDVIISQSEAYTQEEDEYTLDRIKSLNEYLKCENIDNYKITLENFQTTATEYSCVAWGRLYNLKFLKDNNLRFIEKNVIHEDNGFWLKLCSCFPDITYISDIGVLYRIRKNAITSEIDKENNLEKKRNHLRLVMKDVFKYINKYRPKKLGKICKEFIKNSYIYGPYFFDKIGNFIEYKWAMNDKYIYIFNKPLFTEREQDTKIKRGRIFNFKIYKKDMKKVSTEL